MSRFLIRCRPLTSRLFRLPLRGTADQSLACKVPKYPQITPFHQITMSTKRTANSETRKNTATTSSTASNPSVRPCITVQDPPGPLRDAKTPLTCIDDGKKNFHQAAPPNETPATNALTETEQLMFQALKQLQEIYDAPCKTKADKITIERATFAKIATKFNKRMSKSKQKHPHPRPRPLQKM